METILKNHDGIDVLFPQITEQPVMVGDQRKASDQYKALVDAKTGKVFSIVTRAYKLITHENAIEMVESILAQCNDLRNYNATTELYNDGGRIRRTYTFPDIAQEIRVGDLVKLGLNLYNSYDTTWPFSVHLAGYRVVCSNGMVVSTKFFQIRQKHVSQSDEMILEKNIKTAINRFRLQANLWRRMAKAYLLHDDYKNTMEIMKFGKEATGIIEAECRRQAEEVTPEGYPIMTIWTFYNILTAYITRRAVSLNHRVELENRLRLAMQCIRIPRPVKYYRPYHPKFYRRYFIT